MTGQPAATYLAEVRCYPHRLRSRQEAHAKRASMPWTPINFLTRLSKIPNHLENAFPSLLILSIYLPYTNGQPSFGKPLLISGAVAAPVGSQPLRNGGLPVLANRLGDVDIASICPRIEDEEVKVEACFAALLDLPDVGLDPAK